MDDSEPIGIRSPVAKALSEVGKAASKPTTARGDPPSGHGMVATSRAVQVIGVLLIRRPDRRFLAAAGPLQREDVQRLTAAPSKLSTARRFHPIAIELARTSVVGVLRGLGGDPDYMSPDRSEQLAPEMMRASKAPHARDGALRRSALSPDEMCSILTLAIRRDIGRAAGMGLTARLERFSAAARPHPNAQGSQNSLVHATATFRAPAGSTRARS